MVHGLLPRRKENVLFIHKQWLFLCGVLMDAVLVLCDEMMGDFYFSLFVFLHFPSSINCEHVLQSEKKTTTR